ncbi:phytanoyl-CoA hydroxylase-interacting protein-like isoform X2 [Lingula anatina]|nr:phytanoyl-CoA hydroxylase-interacting protein-like isoform X2 [Lingula anatina]XP_013392170.1 phytanoyl-CoA hydroxylase-interacting protein-like isoform X2 [Lingula anatina]XP_013392171.1 phytanoyl-CoA hydroxylase-interacting protein-like isoform X2 [Lingula anatina]XP_013392172.1 phytanoyl-CoA hydroxylase-interacting protein-like isoform X2 [Lingula anatina]|eukprot:XP_013392169.1 phytanoyl-CoA hydroxylase-interacting protein-like isoform X2 [Lingula anatina]
MLKLTVWQENQQETMKVIFDWTKCETDQHFFLTVTELQSEKKSIHKLSKNQFRHTMWFPLGSYYEAFISTCKNHRREKSNTSQFGCKRPESVFKQPLYQLRVLEKGASRVHVKIQTSDPNPSSKWFHLDLVNTSKHYIGESLHVCGDDKIIKFKLKPGQEYKLTGYAIDSNAYLGALRFRAELSILELRELLKRANIFTKNRGGKIIPCRYLYRNKTVQYFKDIFQKDGIMKIYKKDYNGDQGSPINGKLDGLFFASNPDLQTGLPPLRSFFGPRRVNIPASDLFVTGTNLYFADFYCHRKAHYVTLVLTLAGSTADQFCRGRLLTIDPYDNLFFMKPREEHSRRVYTSGNIWVEIFYTENINLWPYLFRGLIVSVPSTGTSRPEGIPKNPKCHICNL